MNLGYMHWRGLGVKKDLPKMVGLYTQGCTGGDPSGCHNLGVQYEKGEGVGQSYGDRRDVLRPRVRQEQSLRLLGNLGRLYEYGSSARRATRRKPRRSTEKVATAATATRARRSLDFRELLTGHFAVADGRRAERVAHGAAPGRARAVRREPARDAFGGAWPRARRSK